MQEKLYNLLQELCKDNELLLNYYTLPVIINMDVGEISLRDGYIYFADTANTVTLKLDIRAYAYNETECKIVIDINNFDEDIATIYIKNGSLKGQNHNEW